jgi:hypothetical protein
VPVVIQKAPDRVGRTICYGIGFVNSTGAVRVNPKPDFKPALESPKVDAAVEVSIKEFPKRVFDVPIVRTSLKLLA